jgi:hypothetical protein
MERALLLKPWTASMTLPPKLRFRAWYIESTASRTQSVRREVQVEFDVKTKFFAISIEGSSRTYILPEICENGIQLNHFDLHVGKMIKIMGRRLTLKKPDLATSTWHETEASFLEITKDSLVHELRKYVPQYEGSVVTLPALLRNNQRHDQIDLKVQIDRIDSMYSELDRLRPDSAQLFLETCSKRRRFCGMRVSGLCSKEPASVL